MVHNGRIILITTKLLEHFGHEVESFGWSEDDSGDLINHCTKIDCLKQFRLFTPTKFDLQTDRVWRLEINTDAFDGFHFNEGMEYLDIKQRVLLTRNRNLYCACR